MSHLSDESDMNSHRLLRDPLNEASNQSQRLSLSLGSNPCRQTTLNSSSALLNPNFDMRFDHHVAVSDYTCDGSAFSQSMGQCWSSFAVAIGSSKYLQPAQSLLEEMLSIRENNSTLDKSNEKLSRKGFFSLSSKLKADLSNSELIVEKHQDYVTLLKLISLLEEVEKRYEEYSHHMAELVSSFEAIAGFGGAKSYTTLGLLAMSKHFCRLRNAIVSQIHVVKKKITRDVPKISSRLSQLSLFDQEPRLNRMIMQNSAQAWRPLRGLPETSVSILRAWLFEHFLHPYPNDSEKLMLASQTGLSKNQVSNWFINARVRLWKPMIEEMYKDEFQESSAESDQYLVNS